MREVKIVSMIPGEWDVTSDKFQPKHFSDWDDLVKFVSAEFDAKTNSDRILQKIRDVLDEWN